MRKNWLAWIKENSPIIRRRTALKMMDELRAETARYRNTLLSWRYIEMAHIKGCINDLGLAMTGLTALIDRLTKERTFHFEKDKEKRL